VEWISTFFFNELKASGFTLLPPEDSARDSAIKVEGAVLKFFTEPVVRFGSAKVESDISVRLVITSRTGLHAERTFFVKGDEDAPAGIFAQGIFNEAIENAMRQLLTEMVKAVLELANAYPKLGVLPMPWLRPIGTFKVAHP
jgi:hypothetical protein